MLGNRLKKNFRHRRKWAKRQSISCFRVYDHDIPEYPLSVDYLDGRAALRLGRKGEVTAELQAEIGEALQCGEGKVYWSDSSEEEFEVQESGHRFALRLGQGFDYGLFLDHRPLRQVVEQQSAGKAFLNLFCYTASFTVYAAAGGASRSQSVDLSKANLAWAEENFRLNGLGKEHQLTQADVVPYLRECTEKFDLIVCDPPTFSNSKRAEADFQVQDVHPQLLDDCLRLLNPGGTLYFSNNCRKFRLDPRFDWGKEITDQTIPEDFSRRPTHRCWRFQSPD